MPVEQRALTEALAGVPGPANPATPFVVAGLKQALDAKTPFLMRFAREHQQEVRIGVCALLFVVCGSDQADIASRATGATARVLPGDRVCWWSASRIPRLPSSDFAT